MAGKNSFVALVLAVASPVAAYETRVSVVTSPVIEVQGNEIAMMGPDTNFPWPIPLTGETIWITEIRSDIFDPDTQEPREEYFCHTQLLPEGDRSRENWTFTGMHAGSRVLKLPEGFAHPVVLSKKTPPYWYGMAADYPRLGKKQRVYFKFTVRWVEDAVARAVGLKPLNVVMVRAAQKHDAGVVSVGGRRNHDKFHFWVPPGKHVFRSPISADERYAEFFSKDRFVHYIHTHLHSYGQWAELWDKTENKLLFRSKAITDPKRPAVLKSIEHYSSVKPIRIKAGHAYEWVFAYDNPESRPISGMLTARFYYR